MPGVGVVVRGGCASREGAGCRRGKPCRRPSRMRMVPAGSSGTASHAFLPTTRQQSSSPRRARPCGLGTGGAHGRWFPQRLLGKEFTVWGKEFGLSPPVPEAAGERAGGGDRTRDPRRVRAPQAGPGGRWQPPPHPFTRALTGGSC